MEIKLNPKVQIKLLLEGAEFLIRKPNMGEIEDLETEVESSKKGLAPILSLLEKLGLPKENARQLDSDQLEQLMAELVPKKKTLAK